MLHCCQMWEGLAEDCCRDAKHSRWAGLYFILFSIENSRMGDKDKTPGAPFFGPKVHKEKGLPIASAEAFLCVPPSELHLHEHFRRFPQRKIK